MLPTGTQLRTLNKGQQQMAWLWSEMGWRGGSLVWVVRSLGYLLFQALCLLPGQWHWWHSHLTQDQLPIPPESKDWAKILTRGECIVGLPRLPSLSTWTNTLVGYT